MAEKSIPALEAFGSRATLDNTLFYMGSLMSFLTPSEKTSGRFALLEAQGKMGNEPPPHLHEWEHELYYLLEGEITFYCGAKVLPTKAGEMVFIPQGTPHALRITSPSVRFLLLVVASGEHPVGTDHYFRDMAEPATSMSLPAEVVTYAMEKDDLAHAISAGIANGTQFLSPEETTRLLPTYPGFGV